MKNGKKVIILFLLIVIIFSIFVIKKWPDRSIKVVFCDVGQGDSILIQQGFFQVLIDSGKGDRLLGCLGHILPFWDQTIEVVLVTHFDDDHSGFFGEIMGIFNVKEIYYTNMSENKGLVKGFLGENHQSKYRIQQKQPILGQTIVLPSGGKLTFLEVESFYEPNSLSKNDQTLGLLLEYGQTKWIFTGDGEGEWENTLLDFYPLPEVDVLKVGHHGSETSTGNEFLNRIFPKTAVISVGKNSFNHPSELILQKLEEFGAQIFRTDQMGDIVFITNGEHIFIDEMRKRP